MSASVITDVQESSPTLCNLFSLHSSTTPPHDEGKNSEVKSESHQLLRDVLLLVVEDPVVVVIVLVVF